jgi:hypothetical protein
MIWERDYGVTNIALLFFLSLIITGIVGNKHYLRDKEKYGF